MSAKPTALKEAARALDKALSADTKFPHVVLGLFGSAGQMLEAWAQAHRAHLLGALPTSALLDGTAELWPALRKTADSILVIPALERCFLRHHRGLRIARQLIETTWAEPRRLIIGCDAWSWKYLQHAVDIDALCPQPLAIPALLAVTCEPAPPLPGIAPRAKDFRLHAYVLHTLLIHGGVHDSALPSLLPFRMTQVLKALAELRDKQLASEEDGLWQVTPQHYADVRRQLAAADFWVSDQ
ncbi:MAG: hypothetical protein WDN72_02545 [Alphaproteobacteria bacterium]